jgi:hypothetical protein
MRRPSNSRHAVRRVVLPSGKTIEIVYFSDAPEASEAAATPAQPQPRADDLHVCPACESTLVHPTGWDQVGDSEWDLSLRCPNCEWRANGVFTQEVVEALDVELDNGTQVLVQELRQLMHANMEEEVDRFASALHAGHIWPMDF